MQSDTSGANCLQVHMTASEHVIIIIIIIIIIIK
jgi:hypothetical protein